LVNGPTQDGHPFEESGIARRLGQRDHEAIVLFFQVRSRVAIGGKERGDLDGGRVTTVGYFSRLGQGGR
jgi:hypothetical protein